jgi:ribonucleoside-diphosphate reductase alpha chain
MVADRHIFHADSARRTQASALSSTFSPSAWEVLRHRYLRKDQHGAIVETPEEMFQRVARTIAAVEANYRGNVAQWEETFFHLLSTLQFLPNSPTLMNAGTPHGQLAACFVLPIEDSLESIFQAIKDMALIHQAGGGTGFSFSHLRPQGDPVASTGGVASGPVSFLRVFDTATDVIKQGGRRRGANMAVLQVDHPDILEFIGAKEDPAAFTNFNFSVAVDDAFMQAAAEGWQYTLRHPVSGTVMREVAARDIDLLNHLWRTPFMLRLHPTGYAQHERALKPLVLSVAQRSRRTDRDLYGTSHLGSLYARRAGASGVDLW